jgi:hypothetical protein
MWEIIPALIVKKSGEHASVGFNTSSDSRLVGKTSQPSICFDVSFGYSKPELPGVTDDSCQSS